jgi:SMI1/KNR4 family protein SUKH-1
VGNEEKTMADIVDYVSRYDPAFISHISGADAKEIATLESLVGSPLPAQYKQFLHLFGRSDDVFALASQGSTNIDVIINHYTDILKGEETPPPPNCIVIGTGDSSVGDVCLQLQGANEPKVVFAMDGEVIEPYAETLEKLLFRLAFNKYRLRMLPDSGIYAGADKNPMLKAAVDIALRLNFKESWFSDEVAFCGESESAGILMTQYQWRGIWIRIGAGNRAAVEKIGDSFQRELGVKFSHWLDKA